MRFRTRWRLLCASLALACATGPVGAAHAQDVASYTIQGSVVDATTQQPLPGVAVTLRGAGAATVTDETGRYRLLASVAAGEYTIEYALIGRATVTRQVVLGAELVATVEPVALRESAVQLEEIVVTGTGVASERRALGNTVASVVGDAVNEAPAAGTIDQALQGKVTGALISSHSGQPGGGVSIRLRGTSSILGGAEPLIVVDGIILENNSSALVGMGANATYSNAALSNRLADIAPADIERIEILKGAAAAALYGSRANSGVIQIFTRRGRQGAPTITYRAEVSASRTPKKYDLLMSPLAGPGDVIYGPATEIGEAVERYDYQDQLWQTGVGYNNQLSISGGDDRTLYYLSGNWSNEDGIVRGTGFERVSARAKVTQRVSDWLEVAANANYLRTQTNFMPEGEQVQGPLTTLIFTPTTFNPAYDPDLGRFPYSPILGTNPLDVVENWRAESAVDRFVGSVQANITPTENLRLTYLFGLDDSREEFIYFQPPRSMSSGFQGSLQHPIRSVLRYNNDVTANHTLALGSSVQLGTTAGFRHTYDRTDVVRAATTGLNPGQTTIGGGGANPSAAQSISEIVTVGGFLQERVSINDRLFVTGGLNVEASSAFGKDQRWQLFPRISGSYVLDEEPFWQNGALGGVVSTLRLRAAYGETGGQPPGAYYRFDNYGNTAHAGQPGLVPSSIAGNPDLKPERQREWEAGFDLGVFGDRASLEFTYYDKLTKDLVLSIPLHPSSGYSSQFQNIGEVSNKGVEVTLSTLNVEAAGFTWTSRLSFATNRNRVEQLYSASDTLQFGYMSYVIEGQPIGVFYTAYYPRDEKGEIILTDGMPRRARVWSEEAGDSVVARKITGDPNPDFTASLSNTFRIGDDLQVGVLLDGRFGNDVANFSRRIADYFGASAAIEQEIAGEVPVIYDADGDIVRSYHFLNLERHLLYEEFIEDGSFVKLREVSIDYSVDPNWLSGLGIRGLTLRVAGRNLYTWTDYTGLDPEVNLFSAHTVAQGVDFATTPNPRSVVFGLTATF
ncbi:MAG TPA: SusC/RagA family TonB-linked outer membrane protein [Longimicrobiales bacterium]